MNFSINYSKVNVYLVYFVIQAVAGNATRTKQLHVWRTCQSAVVSVARTGPIWHNSTNHLKKTYICPDLKLIWPE